MEVKGGGGSKGCVGSRGLVGGVNGWWGSKG